MAHDATAVDPAEELRDASRERLLAEIGTLRHRYDVSGVAQLQARIEQLEQHLLQARDYARGMAAEAGEAKAQLTEARRVNANLRRDAQRLREVYSTRTWRIGRVVLLPVRIIRRVIR